jgi:SsrA-binding protein
LQKPTDQGNRILSDNRRAGYEYTILEKLEAGIVLSGTEVKAAKLGRVQLQDSYAEVLGNEAWLQNAHISEYSHGNQFNHTPVHRRKLLLHRQEIDKLLGKIREKGLTVVVTKMYLKNGRIKVELAVGRGKKLHDKRATEKEKEQKAEARAAIQRSRKDFQ